MHFTVDLGEFVVIVRLESFMVGGLDWGTGDWVYCIASTLNRVRKNLQGTWSELEAEGIVVRCACGGVKPDRSFNSISRSCFRRGVGACRSKDCIPHAIAQIDMLVKEAARTNIWEELLIG